MHDGRTRTSIKFQIQGFAWFKVSYTSPPSEPFAPKSPSLETLNHQHSSSNPNVVTSNNNVIVATIIDLEQDLKLSKSTMKK